MVVADFYHFKRYKFKITHCLDFQALSEYIETIVLNVNEKRSINKVLEVLTGVGIFTTTSSFDTRSLQFVTMSKLKRSMPGGL